MAVKCRTPEINLWILVTKLIPEIRFRIFATKPISELRFRMLATKFIPEVRFWILATKFILEIGLWILAAKFLSEIRFRILATKYKMSSRLNNSGGRQSEGYGKQHHHQVKLNFKFRRFACIGNLGSAAPLASGASAAHVVGWGVPSYWIGCGCPQWRFYGTIIGFT